MFDADRPITTSAQDRLNRAPFAKSLARCLLDHKEPNSLVVGLHGGWGVGKTSLINLVVEELEIAANNALAAEKPIVLNFSPWSYSGQNQLVFSFFRRLSSALRRAEYLDNADKIIYLLELYASYFTQQSVPTPLRSKPTFWQKFLHRQPATTYAWESGQDLTLVKSELNHLLREQQHKIIIIIDNISRLEDHEIKQIFQIVKSMGDYANTAYLLALDKDQVVQAINRVDGHGGAAFIEKIVQLPFAVPPIESQDIDLILTDRLKDVFAVVPEGAWDKDYWADIYFSALKHFFMSCRDITRFVNTLNFSYPRVASIVNPIDFFALTAIEVFAPAIYFGIRDNKDLFTDLFETVYTLTPEERQEEKLRCDTILANTERLSRHEMRELLIRLFPRIRHLYHPKAVFYHSEATARRLRRLCSPDLFDAYFRLSLHGSRLQEPEFAAILAAANDAYAFDQALMRLNQDERILAFLDQLDSTVLETLPMTHITIIVGALLDNGDLFPQGLNNPLGVDTLMRVHRIIHRLLHRLKSHEGRFILLQNAIAKESKSLYISVYELQEQAREHTTESDTFLPIEYRDLMPDQLHSLRKLVATRIANWAANGSLITHPRLLSLLYAWRDWGDARECQRYIETIAQEDRGLLALLTAVLDKAITQAMTEYIKDKKWDTFLDDIRAFIPPEKLEKRAVQLFEQASFEQLREREQLALMIFLDLMQSPTKKMIPKTTV